MSGRPPLRPGAGLRLVRPGARRYGAAVSHHAVTWPIPGRISRLLGGRDWHRRVRLKGYRMKDKCFLPVQSNWVQTGELKLRVTE